MQNKKEHCAESLQMITQWKQSGLTQKAFCISNKGLILCEGETEEKYFKGLTTKEEYRRQFAAINVEIYKPKDHSPRGLVTEAKIKIKENKKDDPYDFVCLFLIETDMKMYPIPLNKRSPLNLKSGSRLPHAALNTLCYCIL